MTSESVGTRRIVAPRAHPDFLGRDPNRSTQREPWSTSSAQTNESIRTDVLRIVLRDVTKRYGGVHALADASLEVAVGEVHALLGENGAGKSTLMNIASGSTEPDEGTIEIDGEPHPWPESGACRRARDRDRAPAPRPAARPDRRREHQRCRSRVDTR